MSALTPGSTRSIAAMPHAGILTGIAATGAMASDFVKQASGRGDAPSDPRPHQAVLGGLMNGVVHGVVGGGLAFVGNGGIEASLAAVTAAAATGFQPVSIAAAAGAFMAKGGGEATVAAVDGAITGFTDGGGTVAVAQLVHETGASIGALGDQVRQRLA